LAQRAERQNEMASRMNERASTAYPTPKSSAGVGLRSSLTPWKTDTAPPATNSPSAANNDHTYASRPYPRGCALSGRRAGRRVATTRNSSFPVSAHECAASAASDGEFVIAAAADFAMATKALAPKAMRTVRMLSEDVPPRPSERNQAAPRRSS